jgi:hypothetical protein
VTLRINIASSQHVQVQSDLMAIAGDDAPKIAVSASGEIAFHTHPNHAPGGYLIANLYDDPVLRVTIHGSDGKAVSVVGTPGDPNPPGTAIQPLCATGMYWAEPGKTISGPPPTTIDVDVVYDPLAVGGPYIGYDPSGDEIPMPGTAQLTFLLAAAAHWYDFDRLHAGGDPSALVVDQPACLAVENSFRLVNFMPERVGPLDVYGRACPVKPHKHATTPPAKKDTTHYYTLPGCFVTTAAYGSPLADKVELVKHFRDDVLAHTRGGHDFVERFMERYYEISPPIAARMDADPELSNLMRQSIVEPLVQWLRLALEMPDAGLDGVPAPWAEFLGDLQATMEEWASEIVAPWDRDTLEGLEGAREVAIILEFVLRRPQSRAACLDDLQSRDVIPLRLADSDFDAARRLFTESGRSEAEIARVLGSREPAPTGAAERGRA